MKEKRTKKAIKKKVEKKVLKTQNVMASSSYFFELSLVFSFECKFNRAASAIYKCIFFHVWWKIVLLNICFVAFVNRFIENVIFSLKFCELFADLHDGRKFIFFFFVLWLIHLCSAHIHMHIANEYIYEYGAGGNQVFRTRNGKKNIYINFTAKMASVF